MRGTRIGDTRMQGAGIQGAGIEGAGIKGAGVKDMANGLAMRAPHAAALGGFVAELRRSLHIRQADLARRAGVSRQWIVAMEQGKPTLEVGLVLRTLETLGLDVAVTPVDPSPAWMIALMREAQARRHAVQARRRDRRRTRREVERLNRLAANVPKGVEWE